MEIRKVGQSDGYWMISSGDKNEPGINGGLSKKGHQSMPNMNTIAVCSVEKFSASVQDRGDMILVAKAAIPGVGLFATYQGTEGNTFSIIEENRRDAK